MFSKGSIGFWVSFSTQIKTGYVNLLSESSEKKKKHMFGWLDFQGMYI